MGYLTPRFSDGPRSGPSAEPAVCWLLPAPRRHRQGLLLYLSRSTRELTEAQELLDLARVKNIAPIPTRNRPLGEAQAALDDLRDGRVVGRTVLAP
jgi:hypothetical protein